MKRRIQNIILLALLGNLGLISFQVYWLRNTYAVNKASFEKDIQEALDEAVKEMRVIEAKGLFLSGDGDTASHTHVMADSMDFKMINASGKHEAGVPNSQLDSLMDQLGKWNLDSASQDSISSNIKVNTIVRFSDSIPAQFSKKKLRVSIGEDPIFMLETKKLVEQVYMTILSDTINLQKIDSLFEIQLSQRSVNTNYRLELYGEDSLLATSKRGPPFDAVFTFENQNSLMPFVQPLKAYFPKQTLFLLKKMALSIGVSLFLVSIMLASFLYMLHIIYTQKQLAEIKNDFINNMTHELKTPISILSTANEALLNFKALDDRNKTLRYLGIFQKELDRLTSMVEKVLNISVYEKDDFSLKKETLDLEEMVQDLISLYQVPRAKPIQISFENQLKQSTLNVDRMHFYNVLNNLFDNATKYSKEAIFIKVRASESEKNIRIEVEDKGIGIAKVHQKSIFEKFYRVPTGNLHNVKGFGLGLNYVKRIIEKHEGNIDLKSELHQGSTFIISLPKL